MCVILIIIYISINIYRTYVCDPLTSYISLVNNSIDIIMSYHSTLYYNIYIYIYYSLSISILGVLGAKRCHVL